MPQTSLLQMPKSTNGILQFADIAIPYQIIRSAKRKRNLAFDFNTGPDLIIRCPARLTYANIQATLQLHAVWLRTKWLARHATLVKRQWQTGETIPLQGQSLTLKILPAMANKITCRRVDDFLEIDYPLAWLHCAEKISTAVMHWLRQEAGKVLQERTTFWAQQMGLQHGRIIITAPRTRWGSCDRHNNLRYNWRIIMATPEVLDYLVVHELAHVLHKNHGPHFWRCVLSYLPNTSALRKQLRNWQPEL